MTDDQSLPIGAHGGLMIDGVRRIWLEAVDWREQVLRSVRLEAIVASATNSDVSSRTKTWNRS